MIMRHDMMSSYSELLSELDLELLTDWLLIQSLVRFIIQNPTQPITDLTLSQLLVSRSV